MSCAYHCAAAVRPASGYAKKLLRNPEWRGRLTFPLHADAESAPSTAGHQVINPRSGRDGQEVNSERFNFNTDASKAQPTIKIKKRRHFDIKLSANGAIEGFHDRVTGKSFLIADHLTEKTAPGTLMHEVGVHMAEQGALEKMMRRGEQLRRFQPNAPMVRDAITRMESAGETSAEEFVAYLVTEYENDRASAPRTVRVFMEQLRAAIRAWLHTGRGS